MLGFKFLNVNLCVCRLRLDGLWNFSFWIGTYVCIQNNRDYCIKLCLTWNKCEVDWNSLTNFNLQNIYHIIINRGPKNKEEVPVFSVLSLMEKVKLELDWIWSNFVELPCKKMCGIEASLATFQVQCYFLFLTRNRIHVACASVRALIKEK